MFRKSFVFVKVVEVAAKTASNFKSNTDANGCLGEGVVQGRRNCLK